MKCPNCEKAELAEIRENYHNQECGLSNVTLVGILVRKCPVCDNAMPRITNIEGLHDSIAQALINKSERLMTQEIVFLHKYPDGPERTLPETCIVTDRRYRNGSMARLK